MAIPEHIRRLQAKRLVPSTDRRGIFEGYRVLKKEHAAMKTLLAALVIRVRRLEGTDSPPDSPPDSP